MYIQSDTENLILNYESNCGDEEELNGNDLVMIGLRVYDGGGCFDLTTPPAEA
jgi:hypothetical protein